MQLAERGLHIATRMARKSLCIAVLLTLIGHSSLGSQSLRLSPLSQTAAAPAIGYVRVSVGLNGADANGNSDAPSLSADGRYVAFTSTASNLVPADTNGVTDIFIYDRVTGQTTRESVGAGGVEANGASFLPSISATGRYVVFGSSATNLVPGTSLSRGIRVFVRDRQLGLTTRGDVTTEGVDIQGSEGPAISGDGRYVAVSGFATNPVVGSCRAVFVRDMVTGVTERAVVPPALAGSCISGSLLPALSGDGRYVAFASDAADPTGANRRRAIFVVDRVTGITTIESVSSNGVLLPENFASDPFRSRADFPSISADGQFVSFHISAPAAGNGVQDAIYLRNRAAGQTLGPGVGIFVSHVSADGRFVSFANGFNQAYAFDRVAGATILIANDVSAISAVGGNAVAFSSVVAQVPADTNGFLDIYVATAGDVGAPGVPNNLAASLFGTTLTLTWNPPVSGDAPTGYVIEAGSTNGGTDVAALATGSTATTFSATVSGGGTFYIRVRAANIAGTSPPSNQIVVTIGSQLAPPSAPIGLAAAVNGSTVTLTWARPLSGGAPAAYILDAGSATGLSNLANITTGASTPSYVASGVAAGSYFVRVRASNAVGTGPTSNEVLVIVR